MLTFIGQLKHAFFKYANFYWSFKARPQNKPKGAESKKKLFSVN